jgi:hypothetical protein
MSKPHRLMRTGLGHQQALLQGRCQRQVHHARRFADGDLQRAQLGRPAQARHRLQRRPRLRRQHLKTRGRQPGHLGRAQVGAQYRHVPCRPARRRRGQAVAAQCVQQFCCVIRIAARVRSDDLCQLGRHGLVHVQHLGDHGDEAGDRQVGQPHRFRSGRFPPAREQRRQRMRGVDIVFPVGAHQQHALDRLLAEREVEQAQRCAPGPLQVVTKNTSGRFLEATTRKISTALRWARTVRSADPPGRRPTASRTRAPPRTSDPRSGRRRIRSRMPTSSSSGSANSSRPSARNA